MVSQVGFEPTKSSVWKTDALTNLATVTLKMVELVGLEPTNRLIANQVH
jgi:hypothetical protein